MGLGDFVSGIFGSKNEFHAREKSVDPNAYQYGGQQGGADDAANRYRGWADGAQSRQGAQADYSQANWDRMAAGQARQGQADVANLMASRAMGQGPSIAGMQADQQMRQLGQQAQQQGQQAVAAQGAQQASARGAAGVAMAGQTAANNIANAQGAIGTSSAMAAQNISGQAQVNAANERMQAEQSALGAFGAVRGGDQASGQMAAQQAQYNAGLHQQQRAQNDQMTMGMTQNEMGVRNAQMTGGMNQQAQISANSNFAQGVNSGVASQNAGTNQENSMGLIKTAAGLAGGAAMSDVRAKTNVHDLGLSPADIVTSTWGSGKGVQPVDIQNKALADRYAQQRESTAAGHQNVAGGFAVPGLSPGVRDPNDKSHYMTGAQPLTQRDQELTALAKAKETEGIELSEDEQRRAGAAKTRLSGEKKSKGPSTSDRLGAGLVNYGNSPTNAPSYHAAPGYVPPVLLPINSGMEMKTAIQPMTTSDERAKGKVIELDQDEGYRHRTMQSEIDRELGEKQRERRGVMAETKRDTPADQRRVKDAQLSKASKDADELMAGMRKSLAHGASVTKDEGDLDNEPSRGPADWLVDYMGSQKPQHAMMMSDDRTKLAAAWDQGHAAATSDIEKLSSRSPADIKKLGETNPLARALTQAKASAWREGASAGVGSKRSPSVRAPDDDHPALSVSAPTTPGHEMTKADFEAADRGAARQPVFTRDSAADQQKVRADFYAPPQTQTTMGAREVERGRPIDASFASLFQQPKPEYMSNGLYSDERTKRLATDDGPIANAARAMTGSSYEYKPEFTPPEQKPGEKNVGPMAQNMARDPVAGTIVKKGPNGYLMLDTAKMVKTLGAIAADQQRQQDEQDQEIATLASRMRRRK